MKICPWCGKCLKTLNHHGFCKASCKKAWERTTQDNPSSVWNEHQLGLGTCKQCGRSFVRFPRCKDACSPSCLRIFNRNKPRKDVSRFEIYKRDKFSCLYCGRSTITSEIELVLDHVVPESKGGKSTFSNLVTSCRQCNAEKYNKELPMEMLTDILCVLRDRNSAAGIDPEGAVRMGQKCYK